MNLALEKREMVTMGGKGRGEIRGNVGKVIEMVADLPATDSLRKRCGAFG